MKVSDEIASELVDRLEFTSGDDHLLIAGVVRRALRLGGEPSEKECMLAFGRLMLHAVSEIEDGVVVRRCAELKADREQQTPWQAVVL